MSPRRNARTHARADGQVENLVLPATLYDTLAEAQLPGGKKFNDLLNTPGECTKALWRETTARRTPAIFAARGWAPLQPSEIPWMCICHCHRADDKSWYCMESQQGNGASQTSPRCYYFPLAVR